MNKFILYLLLTSTIALQAQEQPRDSVTEVFKADEAVPVHDTAAAVVPPVVHVYKNRRFDHNFKDKYATPEFTYETKNVAKTAWDRFWEAVRNFFDDLFSVGNKTTSAGGFNIFMRILAFVVIGFVIYMIVRVIIQKEGMWIFGRSRKSITVQDIQEDIHQMDFRQLTEDTKKAGDYKLAVRYYYLWLLKKLSAREIIDWHWDKTNSDYLYEIKNYMLKKDFEYLSYIYDYSWYGDFPLDETAFAKAEKAFLKTLNTL